MTNFIIGLLLTLYGGGILIKSFIIHPTILDKIHVYGFTSYNAGTEKLTELMNIIATLKPTPR